MRQKGKILLGTERERERDVKTHVRNKNVCSLPRNEEERE